MFRIVSLTYYLFNSYKYKAFDFRSVILWSVRVEGKKFISVGQNAIVQRYGWLLALKIDHNEPSISIGKNCAIGDFCHIAAVRNIIIEDNVLIANKVYIADNIHAYEDITRPIINQPIQFKSTVTIQHGAWIGENVSIIGANIGRNSVVGANSVVTSDIPDYCIAVGTPARIIKRYDLEKKEWLKVD